MQPYVLSTFYFVLILGGLTVAQTRQNARAIASS